MSTDDGDSSAHGRGPGDRLRIARRPRASAGAQSAPLGHLPGSARHDRPAEQSERRTPAGREISNAIVRLLREHTGRGPTRVSTIMTGELAVVTLRDYLTTVEKTLVDSGDGPLASQVGEALHRRIRTEAIAAVERITGGSVAAYFTDQQPELEAAIIVFLFESPPGPN